ncbi:hypothetical protein [Ornithinibacillus scapharcae]|uniref:hypothetical protein n=1 Tax=Ornithinibacillus scapharcae TaxID=1147159 RepID=UPI000225C0E3|nr:hypothetical protein [Ornithinibacillus scapharcae]
MGYSRLLVIIVFILVLFITACDSSEKSQSKDAAEKSEENVAENGGEAADSEDEGDSKEVSFEVENSKAPTDQGDLNVWFKGDVNIEGNKVIAKGTTNLLPESRIYLDMSPEEGTFIGGDGNGTVEPTGAYEIEANIPDGFDGLLHIELSFDSSSQVNEEIQKHYQDGIEGSFARIYYDSYEEKVLTKAAFRKTILFDKNKQSFTIEEPEWDIPEDQGDPNVWIEPTVEKLKDYMVINLKSNLVEETFIRTDANLPDYITTGFSGFSYINPDGSAVIYLEDPEKDNRIKNLKDYTIEIEVDPSHGNNGKQVIEAYGENGEKLTGDLVYDMGNDNGKVIKQEITIHVE